MGQNSTDIGNLNQKDDNVPCAPFRLNTDIWTVICRGPFNIAINAVQPVPVGLFVRRYACSIVLFPKLGYLVNHELRPLISYDVQNVVSIIREFDEVD